MLLHMNGKFTMGKLKSSLLSSSFVLSRPSLSCSEVFLFFIMKYSILWFFVIKNSNSNFYILDCFVYSGVVLYFIKNIYWIVSVVIIKYCCVCVEKISLIFSLRCLNFTFNQNCFELVRAESDNLSLLSIS